MIVKNALLINPAVAEALRKLANSPLPVKTAFAIRRVFNVLQQPSKDAEEARNALVIRYGAKDDKGNVTVTPGNMPEFTEKLKELLEIEVDLKVEKIGIKVEDFDGTARITAADLENVKDFLEITE